MIDQEIQELAAAYGLEGRLAIEFGRDVERKTRQEFFRTIQIANNAAESRTVTERDLERLIWNHSQSKK